MDEKETLDFILKKYEIDLAQRRRMPIDIPGYASRRELARLFGELGLKVGVEIGVESGAYSEIICAENPGVKHFAIDPWKTYRGYRDHVDQKKIDGFYETTKARLAPYGATLVKKFSLDAVKDFADGSLDYVYVDGNHNFQNCTNDIVEWSKKLRYGGILAGHDFVVHRQPTHMHVVEVVMGYTSAYGISPWFVIGGHSNRDAPGRTDMGDQSRSFFWVNAPMPRLRKGSWHQ